MKVLLLAAGRSKRLKPIEDKNFLEFLGKPLIQHQLEQLARVKLKDIFVIGGAHNLNHIKALSKTLPLNIKVIEQKDLDEGMAGAVLSIEKLVKNEPLLVISANDVVDEKAYKLILEASKDSAFESYLIGKKVASYFPGGYLKTAKNGQISSIVEKPGEGKEPSDMVNLVVHFHRNTKALFEALHKAKTTRDDKYEVALDSMMKQGVSMKAIPYDGFWKTIKYPWDVLTMMDHFMGSLIKIHKGNHVEIAKSATLRGNVYLDDGVKIFENAVIVGPAYIGKNTIVATNALVRGSQIGSDCVVGFSTEVARSSMGNNVWTHTNYIGDSIIGDDCSFGSGTVTGNLRLDEANIQMTIQDQKMDSGRTKFGLVTGDHVRCGINTSFMPGIKVGSNCFIGAGITIAQDIPDKSFVYGKTELIIKENKATIDLGKRDQMKKKLAP